MESSVGIALHGLLLEVAACERELVARRSGLGRLRLRPPARVTRRSRWTSWRWVFPVASAAGIVALWWASSPGPLTFAVGTGAAPEQTAGAAHRASEITRAAATNPGHPGDRLSARTDRLPLHFSDGSVVELLRGAEAHVAALDADGATLRIDQGQAEINVRHCAHTRWRVQAGPFDVRVTGTRFSIAWDRDAEAVTVTMREGSVEIVSTQVAGSAAVRVTAGQRYFSSKKQDLWTLEPANGPAGAGSSAAALAALEAPPPAGSFTQLGALGAPPTPVESDVPGIPLSREAGSAVRSDRIGGAGGGARRRWQVLASRGRYEESLAEVQRSGGFSTACDRLGAEPLVQLGDVARLARRSSLAEQAYQAARSRFPRMDRPVFGLGLIAFEQRRDYGAAAAWFEQYRRRFPAGPLASEAAGRAMESWHRAGDSRRAASAAVAYLRAMPAGPYAPLARQLANPSRSQ